MWWKTPVQAGFMPRRCTPSSCYKIKNIIKLLKITVMMIKHFLRQLCPFCYRLLLLLNIERDGKHFVYKTRHLLLLLLTECRGILYWTYWIKYLQTTSVSRWNTSFAWVEPFETGRIVVVREVWWSFQSCLALCVSSASTMLTLTVFK